MPPKKVGTLLIGIQADVAELKRDTARVHRELETMRRKAEKSLRRIEESSNRVGKSLRMMKRAFVAVGLSFGSARIFAGVVGGAVKFEKQLSEIATLLDGDVKGAISNMKTDINALAREFGESTEMLTRGLYDIISAGVDSGNATEVLRQSVIAAKAGISDTAVAADALTTVMNSYGMQAKDVSDISDTFFTTIKQGKTTFDQLAPQIGRVASIAATAGVSFDEVGAVLGILTKNMGVTDEAITGLRAALITFLKPQDTAIIAADKFGINLSSAALKGDGLIKTLGKLKNATADQRAEIFRESRALIAANILIDKYQEGLEALEQQQNNTGESLRAMKTATDNVQHSWDKFKEGIKGMARDIGDDLLPILDGLLDKITSIVAAMQDAYAWIKANKIPALTEEEYIFKMPGLKAEAGAGGLYQGFAGYGVGVPGVGLPPGGGLAGPGVGPTVEAAYLFPPKPKPPPTQWDIDLAAMKPQVAAAEGIASIGEGGIADVTQQWDQLNSGFKANLEIADELAEAYSNVDEELKKVTADLDESQAGMSKFGQFEQPIQNMANTIQFGLGNALMSLADGTKSVEESFASMGQSVLHTLSQMIAKMMVAFFLQKMLGLIAGGPSAGATASVMSDLGPGFNIGNIAAGTTFGHGGGTVTRAGIVPFNRLGADEVPAILQVGEKVIPNTGAGAGAGMPAAPNVEINLHNEGGPQEINRTETRYEQGKYIIDAWLEQVTTNPDMRRRVSRSIG